MLRSFILISTSFSSSLYRSLALSRSFSCPAGRYLGCLGRVQGEVPPSLRAGRPGRAGKAQRHGRAQRPRALRIEQRRARARLVPLLDNLFSLCVEGSSGLRFALIILIFPSIFHDLSSPSFSSLPPSRIVSFLSRFAHF